MYRGRQTNAAGRLRDLLVRDRKQYPTALVKGAGLRSRALSNRRGKEPVNSGCSAVQPCAQPRPPGTEILDAETKRQKSSFKRANARRDQNPGTEWSEIPAETRYSASCRKRAVCGDWMVADAVRYEPVSGGNSLLTGKLTGNFAILGLRSQFRCTKPLCCSDFLRNSLRKLTGKIF